MAHLLGFSGLLTEDGEKHSPWLGCHDCKWGEGNCSRGFPVNTMNWIAVLLYALSMKERVRETLCVMGTKRDVQSAECRASEQNRGRKARGQLHDWLPAELSPLAACLWRFQHCRRRWQTWAYCHWRQWPGCWQLLGYSAGRHLMPPSVNARKKNGCCRQDLKMFLSTQWSQFVFIHANFSFPLYI